MHTGRGPGGLAGGFRAAHAAGEFYLGNRGRCVARCLCQRKVPRCDPADGGDPAVGFGAGADEAEGAGDAYAAGRGGDRQPGRGAAAGGGTVVLQHVGIYVEVVDGQSAAAGAELPDVSGWVLAECAGDSGQVQVPESNPDAGGIGFAGVSDRKVSRFADQSGSRAGAGCERERAYFGAGQPRDGDDLRGADPEVQRREQRGGGGALHAAGCGGADGAVDLHADRGADRIGNVSGL